MPECSANNAGKRTMKVRTITPSALKWVLSPLMDTRDLPHEPDYCGDSGFIHVPDDITLGFAHALLLPGHSNTRNIPPGWNKSGQATDRAICNKNSEIPGCMVAEFRA